MYYDQLTLTSFPLILLYFIIIILIYRAIGKRIYQDNSVLRQIFYWGITMKLLAGLFYAGVYEFFYHFQGDTFYYYKASNQLIDLLFQKPSAYFQVLFGTYKDLPLYAFDNLRYNPFAYRDDVFVHTHLFLSFFAFFSLKNYYIQILIMNAFLYIIQWKFFRMLLEIFPKHIKSTAIAILFIPSVLFWGSGLIKDPLTLSFSQLIVICFYRILFCYKFKIRYILGFILGFYVVISLKPYILYTILMSCVAWKTIDLIHLVKGTFMRIFVLPFLLLMAIVGSVFMMKYMTTMVGGTYGSMDAMMQKAAIASDDLKNERYGKNSFDIGNYDGSLEGAVDLGPKAVFAALYRPLIFEAKSPLMLLSAAENLILLLLTVYAVFNWKRTIRLIHQHSFLVFCLLFAIIFSFGIGLSTSNFGAMVRLRIPLLPYFAFMLLYIYESIKQEKSAS